MKAEYINPFVLSTTSVFATMLSCPVQRGSIFAKSGFAPEYEISGIIGLSGRAAGTVVLSLSHEVALSAAEAMLGERPDSINADVKDVVGELANMVAGAAKAQLAELELHVTIPTVVTGKYSIEFPSKMPPICVPFQSPWGALAVEVGLVEQAQEAVAV